MKLSQLEQFDVLGAMRQVLVRRRRSRVVTEIRNHADAVFFAGLAEQHRLDERAKRADSIRRAILGDEFFGMPAWQRNLAYTMLAAKEAGAELDVRPIR